MAEADPSQGLSSQQAQEAAYRFVAHYYAHERIVPILKLLEAFSGMDDHPDATQSARAVWQVCLSETLEGAPLPEVPPPWD